MGMVKRETSLWFDLEVTPFYSEWKGKLIIDWPPPERAWWRWASRNIIPVAAILQDSALDSAMPPWEKIDLTWEELSILPTRWRAKLSEWRAIYYIFDTSDRKGYVGSAYGDTNLLGRWLNYGAKGHGGNKLLRERDPKNFRFAMAKLKDCVLAQHQGIPLNFDRQTVAEYLDGWLKDAAAPRLRPRTLIGYSQTVNTHLKPALGHIELRTLMPQHIQSMIGSKVTAGLSPRTIRGIRAVLRSALSDAVKWRTLTFNAAKAVSLPRTQRVETRVFTPEQARVFVAAAEADRLGPLFLVALAVGLRLGEALGLRWKDVNLERRELHVRQALQRVGKELRFVEPKSEQSRRTISIPDFAAVLKRHRTTQLEQRLKAGSRWTDSGLVFTSTIGTPLDERNVRRAFNAILKAADLPGYAFTT